MSPCRTTDGSLKSKAFRPPDFFIVGAPKCGTTALYSYISGHPEIFLPRVKEPNYFAYDFPGCRDIQTFESYAALFAEASPQARVFGEASVLYLASPQALQKIRELNPDAKIVAMVRHPIDMFQSYHSQQVYSFNETEKDPAVAWALQAERACGKNISPLCWDAGLLQYKKMCSLGAQLETLLDCFPAGQVKIITTKRFAADTLAVYKEVLEFLGVSYDGRDHFPRVNSLKRHRIERIGRFIAGRSLKTRRAIKERMGSKGNTIHRAVIKLAFFVLQMNTRKIEKQPLSPEFRARLEDAFRGEIDKIEKITGEALR